MLCIGTLFALLLIAFIQSVNTSSEYIIPCKNPPESGNYCQYGFYCGQYHDHCFEVGSIECKEVKKSCARGNFCSKKRPGVCVPNGNTECENTHCEPGFHCGKFHPDECIPNGHTECKLRKGRNCPPGSYCDERGGCISFGRIDCPNLDRSCASGESCGKTQCIPAGAIECRNGNYCGKGTFCDERGSCISFGRIDCPYLNHSCAAGESCGKRSCIPAGAIECASGIYCDENTYCGKFHPGKCYNIGNTECEHFSHRSCRAGEYCGKRDCVPVGHVECSDGSTCGPHHYCSNSTWSARCIPVDASVCPNGLHCNKGSYCTEDSRCVLNGRIYCKNLQKSCAPDESCGRTNCIPNGAIECQNGNYCTKGFYCNADNKCIENGKIHCENSNKICIAGESCGRINCIPAGAIECADGGFCDQSKYCSKLHPGKCINFGTIECEKFSHQSCGDGFYCGKRDCVPVGHVECSDGSTCGPDYYCSNSSSPVKCIPRGSVECAGANAKGHCEAGEECVRGVCVPRGRQLCADNKHHCDRQHQDVSICDGYKELDQKVPCGEDGYLLKHGYRYCRKFFAYFYTLSEDEQKVLKCIIRCLLRDFSRFEQIQPGCSEIASKAGQYHMPCYQECKLCSVRFNNCHPIWRIIEEELTPEENRQMVALMCTTNQVVRERKLPEEADDSSLFN